MLKYLNIKLLDYRKCIKFILLSGYLKNRYVGRIIGRVVNRIADGIMYINNQKFELSKNDNQLNHINGGFYGFDNVNWDSYILGNHVVRE